MKVSKFYFQGFNPIYLDMMIVIVTGMLASLVIVTIGFMIWGPN